MDQGHHILWKLFSIYSEDFKAFCSHQPSFLPASMHMDNPTTYWPSFCFWLHCSGGRWLQWLRERQGSAFRVEGFRKRLCYWYSPFNVTAGLSVMPICYSLFTCRPWIIRKWLPLHSPWKNVQLLLTVTEKYGWRSWWQSVFWIDRCGNKRGDLKTLEGCLLAKRQKYFDTDLWNVNQYSNEEHRFIYDVSTKMPKAFHLSSASFAYQHISDHRIWSWNDGDLYTKSSRGISMLTS